MKINKFLIQEELEHRDLFTAIQMTMKLTMKYDDLLYNKAIVLSARYNMILKEIEAGITSEKESTVNKNKVKFNLNQLLQYLNEEWEIV